MCTLSPGYSKYLLYNYTTPQFLRKRVFLSGDEKEKEGSVLESYTGSHLQRLSCVSGCCLLSRIGGFFLPLSLSSPTSHGEIRRHQ